MKRTLAHKDECQILRGTQDNPGFSMLVDGEGDEVFTTPADWTDEQIWRALEIANMAYATGVGMGRVQKASEIRRAIESD